MRLFVGIIVWVTIIGLLGMCIYGSYTLISMGYEINETLSYKLEYFGIVDESLDK